MKRLYQRVTRWWTAYALAASLAMLGAAHAFERFAGLPPCNLCLRQREVFWAAVVIAGSATFWAVFSRASRGTPRIASFLLAAVFAVLGVLPLVVLAQLGTVICLGVLLDTLLVRTIVVPALAQLLGERFWWPGRVRPLPEHAG